MTERWPLHPTPYDSEPLGAWIRRIARAYDVSFANFCRKVLNLIPEEIDRLNHAAPQHAVVKLSRGTGVPVDVIQGMTLHQIFNRLSIAINEMEARNPGSIERLLRPIRP